MNDIIHEIQDMRFYIKKVQTLWLVRQNKLHPVNHGAGIRFFAKAETEIG